MSKVVIAFLTLLVVGLVSYFIPFPKDKFNLSPLTSAVVHLIPGEGHCTGWYIDDPVTSDGVQTTIMTAKHCTRGMGPDGFVWARMDDYVLGRDLNAEIKPFNIFAVSKDSDLMLLQSKDWERDGTVLKLADSVDIGGRVYAVGYPLGTTLMVSEGSIWNLELIPRGPNLPIADTDSNEFRAVSVMVSPGNSGGPLLNAQNEVVGNASLIIGTQTGSHISFYTDLEDIRAFLKRVKEKFDAGSPE